MDIFNIIKFYHDMPSELQKTRGVYLWVSKTRPLTRPKTHGFFSKPHRLIKPVCRDAGFYHPYFHRRVYKTRPHIDGFLKKPVLMSTGLKNPSI